MNNTSVSENPMRPQPGRRTVAAFAVSLLGVGFVSAQVAPVSTPAPASNDTVVLSPFEVTAEADTGYSARSTLAGSRFKTELKDTAASISVLTAEFLSDIGATDFTSALAYSTSTQQDIADRSADGAVPNGNSYQGGPATFRVRGQPASKARDYFTLRIEADTYNAERIEDARGPNSVLFGFGSPGGILNISTKQARLDRSLRQVTVTGGSFDSHRETLDFNQVMLQGKLAWRLNALYNQTNTFQEYAFNRDRRLNLAVKYRVTATTQFRAEFERALIKQNKARPFTLFDGGIRLWQQLGKPTFATAIASNPALSITRLGTGKRLTYIGNNSQLIETGTTLVTTDTNLAILDRSIADPSINYGGPGQIYNSGSNNISAFIEQRLGGRTFLELGYNHQNQATDRTNPGQTNLKLWGDPNQLLRTGAANPFVGQMFMEDSSNAWERNLSTASSDIVRATISTEFEAGKWGNYRLAAMGDYDRRGNKDYGYREAWAGSPFDTTAAEGTANQVRRRNYVTPGVWNTYYINGPLPLGLIKGAIDPLTGLTVNSAWVPRSEPSDNTETQKSALASGQARYFGGRLVFGAGYRVDKLSVLNRRSKRDALTKMYLIDYDNIPAAQEREARTATAGVVAHLTRNLSVHYNRADNQGLPRDARLIDINNLNGPLVIPSNSEGKGQDIGIAVTLFDGRLDARVSYYTTDAVNQSVSYGATDISPEKVSNNILSALKTAGLITQADYDKHYSQQDSVSYDMASKGYEFNLTANLTKNWRLQANYSNTDTKQVNFGPEIRAWMTQEISYWKSFNRGTLAAGSRTIDQAIAFMLDGYNAQADLEFIGELGTRKHKANVFTRYDLPWEAWRGAYLGGGYRYQSKNLAGSDVTKLLAFYGKPIVWQADVLAGYKFQKGALRRVSRFVDGLTLQLNVVNVVNDDDPLVTRILADGVTVQRAVIQAPRTWRLQAKIDF